MVNLDQDTTMKSRLELPDNIVKALEQAANQNGMTVVEWISERLAQANGNGKVTPTADDVETATARLESCIADYGISYGIDNKDIDCDLAREYGDADADSIDGTSE
jgi:hypothetical protein